MRGGLGSTALFTGRPPYAAPHPAFGHLSSKGGKSFSSSHLHCKLAVLLLGGVLLLAYGPVTADRYPHYVLHTSVMLSQCVVAAIPFWVIKSTACCSVFTKNRTSRTMGIVRRQGLGALGAANI